VIFSDIQRKRDPRNATWTLGLVRIKRTIAPSSSERLHPLVLQQASNKSEKERAAIFKGTAGRVRSKRLPSHASETPIPIHSTCTVRLHAPALLQCGTIGWPLPSSAQNLCRTETCGPIGAERLHAPALLQGGRVAQPRHSPAQRRLNQPRSTLQPQTAQSSCPPPRSPFPAQALSLRLGQHHSPKCSRG
jgi:hypothetical protein